MSEFIIPNRHLAWHDFYFHLPENWEVVGHSTNADRGRMEFASPQGFEAQLSWREAKHKPDLNRINDDVFKNQLKKQDNKINPVHHQLKRQTIGQFNIGYESEEYHFLASTYMPEAKKLIEWVFPQYKPAVVNGTVSSLLKSFSANQGSMRRWSAFGLDVKIPSEYGIAEAKVLPADVMLVFENEKFHRIVVRRWGMPKVFLEKQSLKDFYHRILLGEKFAVDKVDSQTILNNKGVEIEFRRRGQKGMEKLLGSWWPGKGRAWFDEEEQRIYALESVAPKKHLKVHSVESVFDA